MGLSSVVRGCFRYFHSTARQTPFSSPLHKSQSPAEALARLARRYISGYGPAGLQDFAWWSGLPLAEARAAWRLIQPETLAVAVLGRPQALLASTMQGQDMHSFMSFPFPGPAGGVPGTRAWLLPAFDSYLLGYKDRSLILDPAHAAQVNAGGGMIAPVVVVDGRVAGTWRRAKRRGRLSVTISPFDALSTEAMAAIALEAARLGRSLAMEADLMLESRS